MKRDKVLIVMGPIIRGGAELQIYEIVRHLDRHRFEPVICSVSYRPSSLLKNQLPASAAADGTLGELFRQQQLKIFQLDRYPVHDIRGIKQIVGIIQAENIDLVHVNLVIWGQLAGLWSRVPTVPHVRSELDWPDIPRLAYWANLATHRWFKVVVAVSEAVKTQVVSQWHVSPERVRVVHSGIDPERFNPDKIDGLTTRQSLGIKPDEKVIIRVANARQAKGLNSFVELAAQVCQQHPNTRFVLVGDGDLLPELKAQAQGLNLQDRLLFLGRRQDVPQLLAMANIFVSTSLKEASPGSMKEAMAMRLPVVATQVGGHPEIVEDRASGFLTPPHQSTLMAERVVWLLDHETEATAFGCRGAEIVREKFTNRQMVLGVEQAYQAALEQR